jgi:outer membrane immunogenic protein
MKRIVFAAAMAFSAVPAFAADLPPAAPPPARAPAAYVPVVAPVYNWSGIYIGVNGGYGFGQSNWSPVGGTATGNFNVNGGVAGGTIGANFQTGQFVFGVEGDFDWSGIKGSVTNTTTCPPIAAVATTCTFQTSNDWLGTVRGRVGYAWDRVLVYGTAGGAFGDIKANLTNTTSALAASTSNTEFGWTAGGGVEVGITENFTAKVEYLFVDLSNGSFSCTVATCGVALTAPVSFNASLVRAGLNLKFGGF